jgi:putative ABC transport system permease protein
MLRLTVKNLWAYKVRLALTGVAVILGVAFMAGTMVLTDTMTKTFDGMFETANAGIDVVVQQPTSVESDDMTVQDRIPAETVDQIRSVEGVEAAAGTIQGFAQLVNADGTASSLDGIGATLGTNWITDEALNPFSLAAGHAPEAPEAVVLDQATIDTQGWQLGDTITVLAKGAPHELTLVGSATFGDVEGLPGATLVSVNDEAAQQLFAEPGHYDNVAVAAAEGVDIAALATNIDETLGAGRYDVATGEADTAEKQSDFQKDLAFFNQFLMAFAFVSLFVGTFIIYNTFSILVAQRTKDMAMLRAIGASRRQLLRSVIAESALVGVIAGAIGLVMGVLMSFGLKALLSMVGLDIPSGETVVSTKTVITAFVIGVVVTVLSAVGPAVRGSRVRPIAALRDVAVDRSAVSVGRTLTGVAMTALGATAFAAGVVGSGASALQLLAVGSVGVFLGVFVLGPVIARPIVRMLGAPAARGVTGRIARDNATRSPKRTAATASALMVGVALVGFITILASSTKTSVTEGVDKSFRADYVVDSGAWGDGGFAPELAAQLDALPEVEAVSGIRGAPVATADGSTTVDAVETETIDSLFDLGVTDGAMPDVSGTTVAISTEEAAKQHLAMGDTVELTFAGGEPVQLEVAAVFSENLSGEGRATYLIDVSTYEEHVVDQYDRKIYVSTVDSISAEKSREALETALVAYPNAELQDQAGFKESITSEIDTMLNLIYGLLALAVVIALIGIANTLALSIHERRREIGLLRAVGMNRGQVRNAVRWESLLIALLGTALGGLLAVGGAWGIVQALGSEGVTTFTVPPTQMAVIAVLASAAGVLAAVGPARRAARMDVLDAISS